MTPLRRIAIHEAGHAAAYHAFGRLLGVSIVGDPMARFRPTPESKRTQESTAQDVIGALAGGLAEVRLSGLGVAAANALQDSIRARVLAILTDRHVGSEDRFATDHYLAATALRSVGPKERVAALVSAIAATTEFVVSYQGRVRSIADALPRVGSLTSSDLDGLPTIAPQGRHCRAIVDDFVARLGSAERVPASHEPQVQSEAPVSFNLIRVTKVGPAPFRVPLHGWRNRARAVFTT